MHVLRLALALLLAGLCATPALCRPFTVDDLLAQEALGKISLDPTGRYVAIERRGPYEASSRFDLGHLIPEAGTRLFLAGLDAPVQARELTPQAPGYGYLLGPWSPDGHWLVVYRLGDQTLELGVVDVRSSQISWFGLTPASLPGRNVEWRSDNQLLVLVSSSPPGQLRRIAGAASQMPQRWSASARGAGAYTVVGSGVWRDLAPRPEPAQLVDIDASTGRAQVLRTGPFAELKVSSSGRLVALVERGGPLQPANGRHAQGDWGVANEIHRLGLLDLQTGVLSYPCSGRDLLETLVSWAPSAERLLIFARPDGAPWSQGDFYSVEGLGYCQRLEGEGFSPALRKRPEAIETAWLGGRPLARGRAQGEGRLDWWSFSKRAPRNLTAHLPKPPDLLGPQGEDLLFLSDSRLWRLDAEGSLKLLPGEKVGDVAWRPEDVSPRRGADAKTYLFAGHSGGRLRTPTEPIGFELGADEQVVGFGRAANVLLVKRSTPQGVSVLEARKAGGEATTIMRLNASLQDVDPPRVRPIVHLGPNGAQLRSWLYLPASAGAKPPLVVRPYLGDNYAAAPSSRSPVLGLAVDVRVLVGQGYAVLLPSLPLSMEDRDPMQDLAGRVLGIVEAAAIQARGEFDPSRLALWGHSYGGYTALAVTGQTDRFLAAISMNAPTDLISLYGAFQPAWRSDPEDGVWPSWPAGWAEDSQGRMGAPPWAAPSRYVANSPLFLAGEIRTPVMLIHADQDPVPLSQAEEMFSALYRQNKDAMIVTYWGEGHIISSPGNVRDLYGRALGWLDYYLARSPQSWRPARTESGA